jgi:hypothetical protein
LIVNQRTHPLSNEFLLSCDGSRYNANKLSRAKIYYLDLGLDMLQSNKAHTTALASVADLGWIPLLERRYVCADIRGTRSAN